MPVNISSFIHTTKTLDIQSMVIATWPGVKGRLVSIISSRPGSAGVVLTSGVALGVFAVWIIDRIFQKKHEQLVVNSYDYYQTSQDNRLSNKPNARSPQEVNIENRLKTIYATALLLPITIAIAILKISDFDQACFSFPFLTLGFAVGAQTISYYHKNSDHKIYELFQPLKQDSLIALANQLDLSYYWGYLRYLNLAKLGKIIQSEFNDCHTLVFQKCGLTNNDLRKLKEADWFSLFPHINVRNNPQLTAVGIKWIGEGGDRKLVTLDLSRTDLTDNDLIQMAASGYFNHLQTLIIQDNPRITGKGLVRLGGSGFEKLTMLDIGGNSQLLSKDLDEWMVKGEFKNLRALGLSRSNITENDLQKMIEKVEWFRNLHGLDLDYSINLKKFPANISQMTQLSVRCIDISIGGLGYSGNYVHFNGEGLFFRKYGREFEFTPEFMALWKARKVITNHRQYE